MTLDRKDYKSAIPQLEKRLSEVEKIGKDAFNKFEDIAHKTQLDAAEAEKKVLALDYQMTTTRVQMEYQLCTTGQTPVEANWQTTMPSITYNSYQGKTLWYRSKTYVNDIVVQTTEPMTVNLMDGVYMFVNRVSGNAGWTTIDGDKIQTGSITSTNNLCYFDLDHDNFQLKDASTLAQSDNALAWDGSLGTLYIKGDLELAKDNKSYLKAYLANGTPTLRVGEADQYHAKVTSDSFGVVDGDDAVRFAVNSSGGKHRRIVSAEFNGGSFQETSGSSVVTVEEYIGSFPSGYGCEFSIIGFNSPKNLAIDLPLDSTATITKTTSGYVYNGAVDFPVTCTMTATYNSSSQKWLVEMTYRCTPVNDGGWMYATPDKYKFIKENDESASVEINQRNYQLEDLFGTSDEVVRLGTYICAGHLTGTCGSLVFSFPTGRIFPEGTTVDRIMCKIVVRIARGNSTGQYIVKDDLESTRPVFFDSNESFSFYNGNDTEKTLATNKMNISLQGRSNIYVSFTSGSNYFFGGSANANYINNMPCSVMLSEILVFPSIP